MNVYDMDESTTNTLIKLLGERKFQAYKWREQGLKFRVIGERLGVTEERCRQMYSIVYRWINRTPHWTDGLSVRSRNCLTRANICSREEALESYQSGKLCAGGRGPRNYGWKSHKEVAAWLGLPEPHKPERVRKSKKRTRHGKKLS